MWKITIVLALLTVIQASNIQNLYGEWTMVAVYPGSAYAPICIQYTFSESPVKNVPCVFADGTEATPVKVTMMSAETLLERYLMPMVVVNTPEEVMPALNNRCKLGDKEVNDHAVARFVNDNYFILFHYISPASQTEKEPNAAYLFAKNFDSEKELFNVLASIEDLKERNGNMMCTTENKGSKINEIVNNELL